VGFDKRDLCKIVQEQPPIPARMAFGTLYIKESENFPKRMMMLHISENVYMQCFLVLTVETNVSVLEDILAKIGLEAIGLPNWAKLQTKSEVAKPQRFHYDNPGKLIPNRIVSIQTNKCEANSSVQGGARSDDKRLCS